MKDLISIIVPVFNVETYVSDCINSLIKQTYKNLEIILVNDGSTDNSLRICNEYAIKDSRIKIISKDNGGVSDARNAGLAKATGTYIGFVDSDDFIHPQMYELLYNAINQNEADLAVCNYTRSHTSEFEKNIDLNEQPISYIDKNQAMNNIGLLGVTVWNKLYKKSILQNFSFTCNRIHEDEIALHEIIFKCSKIVILRTELYFYRYTQNSITSSMDYKKILTRYEDSLFAFESRIDFAIKNNWNEILYTALDRYCTNVIEKYELLKKNSLISKTILKRLQAELKKQFNKCPEIHVKRKFYIFSKNITLYNLYNFLSPIMHPVFMFIKKIKNKIFNIISILLDLPTTDIKLLRKQINFKLLTRPLPKIKSSKTDTIISLTTYGARFSEIKYTLYSLFNQSKLPDKIILWLDENEFSKTSVLNNKIIVKFIKAGLNIDFCPNYGSYKKIIPTIKKYPNSIIAICDDDAYYDSKWLENLLNAKINNPESIICHSAHFIISKNELLQSYIFWPDVMNFSCGKNILPVGIGGTLLESKLMYKDFTDKDIFMKLAPNGDDLWIWAQAVLNGTNITFTGSYQQNPLDLGADRNWEKLYCYNALKNGNDKKIINILNYYPELKKILNIK